MWSDATEKGSLYDFDDISGNSDYASANTRNKIDSDSDIDIEVWVNLSSLKINNTLVIFSYAFINSYIKNQFHVQICHIATVFLKNSVQIQFVLNGIRRGQSNTEINTA